MVVLFAPQVTPDLISLAKLEVDFQELPSPMGLASEVAELILTALVLPLAELEGLEVQEELFLEVAFHCNLLQTENETRALQTQLQMLLDLWQSCRQLHQHLALLWEILGKATSPEAQMAGDKSGIYPDMYTYHGPNLCKEESAHKHMYPIDGLPFRNNSSSRHST